MPEKHIQELETSRIVNETHPLGRTEGRNRDPFVTICLLNTADAADETRGLVVVEC